MTIRVEITVWPKIGGWPVSASRDVEPVEGSPLLQQAAEVAQSVYGDVADKLLATMIEEG